jgi:prepilin-type N-terminal cleavage/methylation domain-containing protein
MLHRRGFTLIELLIVVAIIAILAAIAVPNFLEAQVRSKVSRCKADMRSLLLAGEAYKIDNNKYMPDNIPNKPDMASWCCLSTPIAYITSVSQSPFKETKFAENKGYYFEYWCGTWQTVSGRTIFVYDAGAEKTGIYWRGSSNGPDNNSTMHRAGAAFTPFDIKKRVKEFVNLLYDPTNGTTSEGDFFICNQGIIN